MTPLLILGAVVVGWVIQLQLSYRQSMAFNRAAHALRKDGTVSIGQGGRRYRGGRAFVAIAVDERGIVRNAIALQGFTTFARSRTVPGLVGSRASQLRGDRELAGVSRQQREAARQAAGFLPSSGHVPA